MNLDEPCLIVVLQFPLVTYFEIRRLQNTVIEIGAAVWIPLIFNHLNCNSSKENGPKVLKLHCKSGRKDRPRLLALNLT